MDDLSSMLALSFVSVGLLVFGLRAFFSWCRYNEQRSSLIATFRARALEMGRGRGNLETVAADNPSASGAGPSTAIGRSRKRGKDASNIVTTTRSPGSITTPPWPPSPINLGSFSPVGDTAGPSAIAVSAPILRWPPISSRGWYTILKGRPGRFAFYYWGASHYYSWGGPTLGRHWDVMSESHHDSVGCWCLRPQGWGELATWTWAAQTSSSLKSFLEAVSTFEGKMTKVAAELEIA